MKEHNVNWWICSRLSMHVKIVLLIKGKKNLRIKIDRQANIRPKKELGL